MEFKRKVNESYLIGSESVVLLKNENGALPLKKGEKIAGFGSNFYFCFKSGHGSGDVFVPYIQPYDYITDNDVFCVDKNIADHYIKHNEKRKDMLGFFNRSDPIRKIYSLDNPCIPLCDIENSSKKFDTAIITIGRNEGEWVDLPENSLCLSEDEEKLIEAVTKSYKKTVLILNMTCPFELDFLEKYHIDALLLIGYLGETAGKIVCDVLSGEINPSGKLPDSFAPISSYPTHEGFFSEDIPYNEGIYVGYRYFDTFDKPVYFPFGHGLSYTEFSINAGSVRLDKTIISFSVKVKNEGDVSGKEVVQIYLSEPKGKLEKAYQKLCAFKKTSLLNPQEEEKLEFCFDLVDFASYDEKTASYILDRGEYYLRVGNSSRNTKVVFNAILPDTVTTEILKNNCVPQLPLDLISSQGVKSYTYENERKEKSSAKASAVDAFKLEPKRISYRTPSTEKTEKQDAAITFEDVKNGKYSTEEFVSSFSDSQLCDMLNGITDTTIENDGVIGSMSHKVKGAAGETWCSEELKLPTFVSADGPQGIRLSGLENAQGEFHSHDYPLSFAMTCYPAAFNVASTFNTDLSQLFGRSVADDMRHAKVSIWLAPGMNIHRNPYCGRNFEYYSEDPYLSGCMAAAITDGVQKNADGTPTGLAVTIKHFCCNNQENFRQDSDSRVSERALREIYLKGFEIAIKKSQPIFIMNSYNKMNGDYAAHNFELNTSILRDEWDFEGAVMTDWVGKYTSEKLPLSGCSLAMPGKRNKDYLNAVNSGIIPRKVLEECAVYLINALLKLS